MIDVYMFDETFENCAASLHFLNFMKIIRQRLKIINRSRLPRIHDHKDKSVFIANQFKSQLIPRNINQMQVVLENKDEILHKNEVQDAVPANRILLYGRAGFISYIFFQLYTKF